MHQHLAIETPYLQLDIVVFDKGNYGPNMIGSPYSSTERRTDFMHQAVCTTCSLCLTVRPVVVRHGCLS